MTHENNTDASRTENRVAELVAELSKAEAQATMAEVPETSLTLDATEHRVALLWGERYASVGGFTDDELASYRELLTDSPESFNAQHPAIRGGGIMLVAGIGKQLVAANKYAQAEVAALAANN